MIDKQKAIQTILSFGIFCIFWKICNLPFFSMSTISKWSAIPAIFWILWAIEATFMLWWLLDELKLAYLSVNPFVYVGWLWLFAALGLYLLQFRVVALILVGIAALPLAIMALFAALILVISIVDGPIRWN